MLRQQERKRAFISHKNITQNSAVKRKEEKRVYIYIEKYSIEKHR